MAPRKNNLLPYVRPDKNGRLTYERRIPQELRQFCGGKASVRRTLATTSTDVGSTAVLTAYAAVHSEVEALIQGAINSLQRVSAKIIPSSAAITAAEQTFPLSKREIAGIAGQVLLDIRDAVANQKLMSREFTEALVALGVQLKSVGISGITPADMAGLARPSLDSLGIAPTPADMTAIGEALMAYVPVMAADMQKLEAFDYSEPKLKTIAPPMPKRQVSWRDLFDAWLRSTGGVLEQDGYGVSQERQAPYLVSISEFRQTTTRNPPSEVTIEEARAYIRWLQEKSGSAPRTQQARLTCLKNLLKVGVRQGLIDTNVFADLTISTPAGVADAVGYRSFTKDELIRIFELSNKETTLHYRLLPWILLCTGCRLSEALQIRTTDLKQTASGVWFIDWRHEPLSELPVLLKTKASNNRQCPMHPRLVEAGLPKLQAKKAARIFPDAPGQTAVSQWFKRQILQKLEIWEKRKTVVHSIRGSARDAWREAGMPQDYRNAMTGHVSRDVGERHYGEGLRSMPDTVHKELIKVDLSFL